VNDWQSSFEEQCRAIWSNAVFLLVEKCDGDFLKQPESGSAHDNTLCIIVTSKKQERVVRNSLLPALFSRLHFYALAPDYRAPRWIVPLDNRRVASSSFRFYSPHSLKGKLFKHTVSCLTYFGIQRVLGHDRLFVVSKKNAQDVSLTTFLQELLNVNDIYLAFSMGTPGYYRKTTAQIMSGDGQPLAYAKIAYTPQARELLIREASALRRLAVLNISTGHMPRLLYSGQFHESDLLIQSAPSGKTRRGTRKLGKRHTEFLAEIFNLTSTWGDFLESAYWERLKKDVVEVQEWIGDNWYRRLQDALDVCESTLADRMMPLGLCHRDFTPWNTCVERERLYVFDWEYAAESGIPFWDIFHFVCFPAMLVTRPPAKKIIARWRNRRIRELLERYAKNIGVDPALVPVCFLLYLVEVSCFYLKTFHSDGLHDTQREWLKKTWAEMLDELTVC